MAAIALSSSRKAFAAAHIGLTYSYSWTAGLYMNVSVEDARRLASVHARKAVELDPGDADALAGLTWIQQFYGEMDNLLGLSRRALAINPNCARAYVTLGVGLIKTARTAEGREAIAVFERLTPRDPSITIARRQIVVSHYFDRDDERCVDVARRLLGAEPDMPLNNRWMAAALGQLGRAEEARAALDKAISFPQGNSMSMSATASRGGVLRTTSTCLTACARPAGGVEKLRPVEKDAPQTPRHQRTVASD